jgi:hypothetical protein
MYGDDLPDCKLVPIAWDLPATVSLVVYTEGVSIPIVTGWFREQRWLLASSVRAARPLGRHTIRTYKTSRRLSMALRL